MARIFIAIRFDDEVKKALVGLQDTLKAKGVKGLYFPIIRFLQSTSVRNSRSYSSSTIILKEQSIVHFYHFRYA